MQWTTSLLKVTPVCRPQTTFRTLFTGNESTLFLNAKHFAKTSGHVPIVNWKSGRKTPKIWFRLYTNPRTKKTHLHPVDNNFSVQVAYVTNQLAHLLSSETTIIKKWTTIILRNYSGNTGVHQNSFAMMTNHSVKSSAFRLPWVSSWIYAVVRQMLRYKSKTVHGLHSSQSPKPQQSDPFTRSQKPLAVMFKALWVQASKGHQTRFLTTPHHRTYDHWQHKSLMWPRQGPQPRRGKF